jgi:hypothetical protein
MSYLGTWYVTNIDALYRYGSTCIVSDGAKDRGQHETKILGVRVIRYVYGGLTRPIETMIESFDSIIRPQT